ncbi:MAG: hypothetical protein IKN24_04815 [Lachnospiraceae bacterium]|nr:hypothetical protein [Lachnospiraceae bacterium]
MEANRKLRVPIIIAAVAIAAAAIIGLIVFLASGGKKDDKNIAQETTQGSETDPSKENDPGGNKPGEGDEDGAFTVSFAVRETASAYERENAVLPASVAVAPGTQVGQLDIPECPNMMFLAYSYDAAGIKKAQDTDRIDGNITLYPCFATMDGMGNTAGFDYVSKTDVDCDYAIDIITYGLTEDEIRSIFSVEHASMGGDPMGYDLISIREKDTVEWLTSSGIREETAKAVWTCIKQKETESAQLTQLLNALTSSEEYFDELSQTQITDIVTRFAPEEITGSDYEKAPMIDDDMQAILEALDIDIATVTPEALMERYGLSEDDSLQRFWREDVGLTVEQVLFLEDIVYARKEIRGDKWQIVPRGGAWEGGEIYSIIASDTSRARFIFNDEPTGREVVKYNITTRLEEVENISIDPRVIHLNADEVEGVEYLGLLSLEMDENGNITADENTGSGVMTYNGSEKINAGDTVAVNRGAYDENGLTSGEVAYLLIKEVQGGGKYAYEYAKIENVLFIADNIPVKDDGNIGDGTITIAAADLDFSKADFSSFGLDEKTKLDAGDYLTFYTGSLGGADYKVTGHAVVDSVSASGESYTVTYSSITEEQLTAPELLLYTELPQMEFELTQQNEDALREQIEKNIMQSGIVEETEDFFTALLTDGSLDFDSYEHGDELRRMVINTDGEDLTLADLRLLADGGKVEVSDVHVTFLAGINLQHFSGKGLRGEAAVTFTISIAIGDAGSLEIQPAIVFEQEFLLTPSVKVVRNKNKVGFTSSLDITASFSAGTYSGLGVTVTAQTKAPKNGNADKDWSEMVGGFIDNGNADSLEARQKAAQLLIRGGDFLQKQSDKQKKKNQGQGFDATLTNDDPNKTGKDSKQDYVSPGLGGDLPDKYSRMLSNDAKYIKLVDVDLGSFDMPIDPAGIIHVGLKINFNISMKINAMIGAGVTYENAKCYSYHFRAKIWGGGDEYSESNLSSTNRATVTDIKESTFRADFYAFGMVGVRMGVSIDLRVGVFSTDLDSVGVVASAGAYAELYGFLYVYYEKKASQPAKSGASGSLLFEVGIYTDISVKVQIGAGKASKSWSLYSSKLPFVQLGCVEFPLDFIIKPTDSKLQVKIPDGQNTVKLDSSIFEMKLMALNSGKVVNKNMDSNAVSEDDATPFTATIITTGNKEDTNGLTLSTSRSWKQFNEKHFIVECFDLTSENGERIEGASSFQYLPGSNEIFICPLDNNKNDIWGEVVFTYRNNAFGFNTEKLQRTVKVHWTGVSCTAMVEYYLVDDSGQQLAGTGAVSGFDAIRCYVDIDEGLCNKFPGYGLLHLGYPDEDDLRDQYYAASDAYSAARRHANALSSIAATARVGDYVDVEKELAAEEAQREANRLFEVVAAVGKYYELYYENNEKAVAEGKGTTYFTMRGNNTIVRIYYKKLNRPTTWTIYDDEGEWKCSTESFPIGDGKYTNKYSDQELLQNRPILEFMPSVLEDYLGDHYSIKWYTVDCADYGWWSYALLWEASANAQQMLRDGTFYTDSRVKPVDKDTLYDGTNVAVIGVATPDRFTVRWLIEDEAFAITKVKYGGRISVPDGEPKKDGYTFVSWISEDGEDVDGTLRMPGHDIEVYPVFAGDPHKVTWIYGKKRVETDVTTGSSIYDCVPEELLSDGFVIWRTQEAEGQGEIAPDYDMPNSDLTLYGRPGLGFSSITWMEDDDIIRKDYVEIGTKPVPPELTAREGLDLVWMINDEVMQSNYLASREDIFAFAFWHKHEWSEETSSVAATCSAPGLHGTKCSVCGLLTEVEEIPIDPNAHKWVEYTAKEATCCEKGVIGRHCAWCDAIDESYAEAVDIDPTNHTGRQEVRDAEEPTCKAGYTGDTYCADCGELLFTGEAIPATGAHTKTHIINYKEPTCTVIGYSGDEVCDNCGICVRKGYGLPTKSHVGVLDGNMDATCVSPGKVIWKCENCDYTWTVEYSPIDPEAHDWDDGVITKKANCGQDGIMEYTCKLCGEKKQEKIPGSGEHVWGDPVKTAGSCSKEGVLTYTCSVCGETKTQTLSMDKDNHLHLGAAETVTPATCETPGQSRRKCSDCGEYVYETIPAKDHDWGTPTYTWSDDYSTVTATVTCKNDANHKKTETVGTDRALIGAASCESGGKARFTTKPFTTTALFTQQTKEADIPATGHTWGEPSYTWSADYSKVTATRTCTVTGCTGKETETVNTTSAVTKPATAAYKGETTYTAAFTNPAFTVQTKTVANIDSTDPHWSAVNVTWAADYSTATATRTSADGTLTQTETKASTSSVTAAGCETDGKTVYTVTFANTDFGTVTKEVAIPKTGHVWQYSGTITEPQPDITWSDPDTGRCNRWIAGTDEYTCSNGCGKTKTEPKKVSIGLAGNGNESWVSVNGTNVTIDLGAFVAANAEHTDNLTMETFFREDLSMTTIDSLFNLMVSLYPYSSEYAGWYTNSNSSVNDATRAALYGFYVIDEGSLVYDDPTQATLDVTTYSGSKELTVKMKFVPNDTNTYETQNITVKFIFSKTYWNVN